MYEKSRRPGTAPDDCVETPSLQRFGGKRVYGYCMLVTALATLLTPIGARGSPYLLVALRIIKGLGEVGHSQPQSAR